MKIYGLCSSSDLRKGTPFEEIAARVHSHFAKWECRIDSDGIAIIDLRNEIYRIDTKRDFWPIERKTFFFDTIKGKKVKVPDMGQDIKLVEINGSWVPKRVDVIVNSASSYSYEFDWISYDEPLAPDAFDLKKILKERWSEKEKPVQKRNK